MKARSKVFARNRVSTGNCRTVVSDGNLAVRSSTTIKPYRIHSLVWVASLIVLNSTLPARAQVPVQTWVQRYGAQTIMPHGSQAVALGLDTNGNVFVTGSSWSGTNCGYATLKYSNAGALLWAQRLDAPGDLSNVPVALAVDSSGNVFVTGSSFAPGPAYPGLPDSYLTVAYSASGTPLWTNTYSDGGNEARATAIAVHQNGNVFVTGFSWESTNDYANMTTLAYSAAGVPLWTNRYKSDGPGGTSFAYGIALDAAGNVFVVGYSWGADGHQHYVAVAYSNAGLPLWTNQYIGPSNLGDAASAVAVGAGGSVLVTGSSCNTNGSADFLSVAYSSAGVPLWTNRYATANGSRATAIAVDNSGNVFVTGGFLSVTGFSSYATAAYSPAGLPLWTNRYAGPGHDDIPMAVVTDSQGNVFVTGYSTGISSLADYATIGYSSAGVPLWTNRYNGPANGNDNAAAIAVDRNGNIFVTGSSSNGTNFDFATIKYSVQIPLFLQQLDNRVVLSWTNPQFRLQSAPSLSAPFIDLPGAASPYTNPAVGPQQFFRLISN